MGTAGCHFDCRNRRNNQRNEQQQSLRKVARPPQASAEPGDAVVTVVFHILPALVSLCAKQAHANLLLSC